MPKFSLSEFVEQEIDAIWHHIALDNPDAADRFIEAAHDTMVELARTPGLGPVRKFQPTRLRGLRSFRVKGFDNYLIFYRPVSDGIEVLHVLHGARDLDRLL